MTKAKKAPEPTGYNGWTNYETWAVNMWLGNEESSYRYWNECAKEARAAHGVRPGKANLPRAVENAARDLADRLKDELGEQVPDLGATLWADLLNSALSEVDWYEIADALLAE